MIEDETRPLTADPKLDSFVRFVVGAVLIFGGGFFALEFIHWLAHGGLPDFLIGSVVAGLIFFGLVLWSCLLSDGSRFLRSRPAAFLLVGLLVAGGLIGHLFIS